MHLVADHPRREHLTLSTLVVDARDVPTVVKLYAHEIVFQQRRRGDKMRRRRGRLISGDVQGGDAERRDAVKVEQYAPVRALRGNRCPISTLQSSSFAQIAAPQGQVVAVERGRVRYQHIAGDTARDGL